ncbi:hypothetical protein Tco_0444672 [Tanacetum coccineum]
MSSPSHPTSNIEDAFSSNFLDYIPASPDYVPALPGKTYSSSSNNPFGMPPKRTPTSEAPTMTQAGIRKLVVDSVTATLKAQAVTMENSDNTNRNTREREAHVARKYKKRYNADIWATNILLQGLPKDIYSLINHYTDAKNIWDNVKMLLEGSELTKEDRESQLYDDFEHFRQYKGETIHDYYVRFSKLINDMRNIKMTMSRMQLNSKFVNNMLPEWGRFVTAMKLNRGLRDSNYDQLYAYLKQHEAHANVQDGRVVVQNVQGRQNRGHGNNARGAGAAGYGGAQNRVGNANPGQARQVDKTTLLMKMWMSIPCNQGDLALNVIMGLQLMTVMLLILMLMRLLRHKLCSWQIYHPRSVYDEAGRLYDRHLSEYTDHNHYQDVVCEHHEEHEMHDDVQINYDLIHMLTLYEYRKYIPYDPHIRNKLDCMKDGPGNASITARSNTKKIGFRPAKGVNKKKVEEHPRINKSILRTTNRVDSSSSSKRTIYPDVTTPVGVPILSGTNSTIFDDNGIMSSPNHPTSNIEDAFSSNFPDYIPTSPDYVPASPTLSLFHDDPYMKVMHAYYATESHIPPPTIVPPSSMLSPMFNP